MPDFRSQPRANDSQITRGDFPAFLMSVPLFLATDAPNNVWMREMSEEARSVDRRKALAQFRRLYEVLATQAVVYLLPSTRGLQDQTYVANLAVVLPHTPERRVVLSTFRSKPRRAESAAGAAFFEQMGLSFEAAPPFFEGEADLKYLRENVYIGAHGMRTSREALDWFAARFDMEVIPFQVDNEYLYHLDCSVFPITRNELMVCTEMAAPATLKAIEKHVDIIDVDLDDAESGITNCMRIGDSVLSASSLAALPKEHEDYPYEKSKVERLEAICRDHDLTPVFFDLSEFQKSGAMLSCMVMHLNFNNF